jgi:intein-encoded DNA endonuclease-like protein
MMSIAEELHQKTMAYWKLSQIWNGKREVELATGDAIELCSHMIETTNITRPLSFRAEILLQEIVLGEGSKAPDSKVLEFPAKRKA